MKKKPYIEWIRGVGVEGTLLKWGWWRLKARNGEIMAHSEDLRVGSGKRTAKKLAATLGIEFREKT